KAVSPIWIFDPTPNWAAVDVKLASGKDPASPMKAVLQDMANACSMESEAVVSPSKLWNTSPLTVIEAGHVAGLEGVAPCSIRSLDVTTLKVEPGGEGPSKALVTPPGSGGL